MFSGMQLLAICRGGGRRGLRDTGDSAGGYMQKRGRRPEGYWGLSYTQLAEKMYRRGRRWPEGHWGFSWRVYVGAAGGYVWERGEARRKRKRRTGTIIKSNYPS